MAISYRVYVGPFVKANLVETEVTRSRIACSNSECVNHKRWCHEGYCPKCGSKISEVFYKEVDHLPLHHELQAGRTDKEFDEFCDHLMLVGGMCGIDRQKFPCDYYYPNKPIEGIADRKRSFDPCGTGMLVFDYDTEEIEKEKEAFQKTFAEHIALLEQWHGKENISIRWGTISWA